MTGADRHVRFEELVAGHSLYALEPEDEQELRQHLMACDACQRDLAVHRGTLAELAYAGEELDPPAAVWEAVRREVAGSGDGQAFSSAPGGGGSAPLPRSQPGGTGDLAAARARRGSPRLRAAAPWLSAAAAALLVVGVGVGWKADREQQGELARDLRATITAMEQAPASTVPLTDQAGQVQAVAVVRADRLSLIVDGLPRNDLHSSLYVLWGVRGVEPPEALASFDVTDDDVQVVRDLALPAGGPVPELFVVTKEAGRTAPAQPEQPAVASGRVA